MDDDYDDELWLSHCACTSWMQPRRWAEYFDQLQHLLGASITHLDEEDPIRRRFNSDRVEDEAAYVTRFGQQEDSRWLFGKFADIGVHFSIWYFRDGVQRIHSIDWHFPSSWYEKQERLNHIIKLFDCGNILLESFYSFADLRGLLKTKNKEEGAVDLQQELLGVFWLTYFNERYVEFFGRERFAALEKIVARLNGGAMLRLAETPLTVQQGLRQEIENKLNPKSFVRQRDFTVKRPGQYALTFEQLIVP